MKENTTLSEIFEINTGLVLSRKESKTDAYIAYKQISLKSINDEGFILESELEEFRSQEEIKSKYITKIGDIVIRLTTPYTVVSITKETEGLLVNSYCAILRSKFSNISSKYIAIYLNSGKLIEQFRKEAIGSIVQIIKISSLKNYVIDYIPNEKKQIEVVKLNELLQEEILIYEELLEEKYLFKKGIIRKLLEEN